MSFCQSLKKYVYFIILPKLKYKLLDTKNCKKKLRMLD